MWPTNMWPTNMWPTNITPIDIGFYVMHALYVQGYKLEHIPTLLDVQNYFLFSWYMHINCEN